MQAIRKALRDEGLLGEDGGLQSPVELARYVRGYKYDPKMATQRAPQRAAKIARFVSVIRAMRLSGGVCADAGREVTSKARRPIATRNMGDSLATTTTERLSRSWQEHATRSECM